MSVILQIAGVVWTQGYSGPYADVNITNSGTENITDVTLKVTDSVVFTSLKIAGEGDGNMPNCLNTFSGVIRFINGGTHHTLAAGQTSEIRLYPVVKAGAPVQIHNLTCEFQYATY